MRGRQPKKSRPSSAELRLIQQVMARTPRPAGASQAESPVTSVAGKTGDVALTKADVGLSNVENTSDASKPVSTATQTALNAKAAASHNHDASYAAAGHNHDASYEAAGAVASHAATADPHTGYQKESERGAANGYASLGADGKVPSAQLPASQGGAAWGDITGTLSAQTDLQSALDGKSASGHNHTGTYEPANANIQTHVASAHAPANAQKNSDILKSEIEAKLTGEISSHTHAGGGSSPWTLVKKTADESRNLNVTLTADSALVVALNAATRYRIYINVMLTTANATMDYKYDCNYTGTITSIRCKRKHAAAGAVAGTDVENTQASAAIVPSTPVAATTTGVGYVEIEVNILTLTAGTLQFRWAQNTSDAGLLTVLAGSYLEHAAF